ncbi:MAG: hypothetical protein CFE34_18245 [Rhodobacteraceae bacterium PARR1]|nr:MAG: hypothetical protein CFE34_18245 [Rhodobacteraceae bacterium PARR1]
MDTKFNGLPEAGPKIVYIRPVAVDDLPAEVQAQLDGMKTIYAMHDQDGDRLALVLDREMAFVIARQNDFAPVNVH